MMGLRSIRIEHCVRTHLGSFEEAAFALLGNPAPLYTELLRRLGPYGATVKSLNMDVGSLESAHVACQLSEATVRVRLMGLEVVFNAFEATATHDSIIESAWSAIQSADSKIRLQQHDFTVGLWAAVDGGYALLVRDLVRPINNSSLVSAPTRAAWDLKIGEVHATIGVDEATDQKDNLFTRITANYPGSLSLLAASAAFIKDSRTAVEALGLSITTEKK
jgi:hypothetical protein